MEKDLESESNHKARPRGERRLDLGEVQPERAGEAERSEAEPYFLLFVVLVVSIYIVDSVNYIGLYIQLVMYDFVVQFCTILRMCDFVGFCEILACFIVRRIT